MFDSINFPKKLKAKPSLKMSQIQLQITPDLSFDSKHEVDLNAQKIMSIQVKEKPKKKKESDFKLHHIKELQNFADSGSQTLSSGEEDKEKNLNLAMSFQAEGIHNIFASFLDNKENHSTTQKNKGSKNVIVIPSVNSSRVVDEMWHLPSQKYRRLKSS